MKYLKACLTLVVLLMITQVYSQQTENTKNHFWEKVRFGGGLQLSIGSTFTTIGVSPSAIYEFSDKFASGVGVSYLYSKYKLQDVRYNIYGASALVLYNPITAIQLSTEFEELNIHTNNNGLKSDYWNPALYLGVAYSMNKHASMGVRYDVLYEEGKSIYDSAFNPFVRIYF